MIADSISFAATSERMVAPFGDCQRISSVPADQSEREPDHKNTNGMAPLEDANSGCTNAIEDKQPQDDVAKLLIWWRRGL